MGLRMRLLHLVKHHDRVGMTADGFGKLSGIVETNVPRGGADQAADVVTFHKF